jgi:hypothetical protein
MENIIKTRIQWLENWITQYEEVQKPLNKNLSEFEQGLNAGLFVGMKQELNTLKDLLKAYETLKELEKEEIA